ncbi:MAG TPA: toll/interleukin-1 receptor domain-containing protein [Fimbriiglobus sp.]|nr:toll/interleukin-1 receptor domain-containing protein [Fimbriiglobus sp.]
MSRGDPERFDVFLSHAPADAVLAEAVRQRLAEAGLTCYSILSGEGDGDSLEDRLRHALDISRAYVAVLSRSFVQSPNLLIEVGAAWAAELPTFFLLNDVRPTEVPAFFGRFKSYRLWDGLPKLIAAVRELPERQSV